VAISDKGSLDMAQWNFVIDWVMFAVAKVESRQLNQHCGGIGVKIRCADCGGGGGGLLLLMVGRHAWFGL
jgi:hypothetical protein